MDSISKGGYMEKTTKRNMQVTMGPLQIAMVLLLIGGAYFLGRLTKEVEVLRNGVGGTAGQPTAQAPQAAPPQTADDVERPTAEDWVKGDRNAEIALIEYSDLECPFCKQFHPTAEKLVEEYGGKLMWVFRHYPLSFHANAQKEAEAAECAGSIGGNDAFWKYVDTIYERTTATGTGFALDDLGPLAKELGLDQTKFDQCLESEQFADKVTKQMDGGTAVGVSGTPGNILLNVKTGKTRLIPGAYTLEQMKTEVDALLNG
jgi:protein-disulfide isomerase